MAGLLQTPLVPSPVTGWSAVHEAAFRSWYSGHAKALGINPDPDALGHQYDYRRAFLAGVGPGKDGHWPSKFKLDLHPNRFLLWGGGGIDTRGK